MAHIELAFKPGVMTSVDVDDRNLLFNATHRKVSTIPDQKAVIEEALAHPIGTPPLEEWVRPDDSVLILVDDVTRPTPAGAILPHILRRIHGDGR